jgi:hypothetical protein
MFYPDYRCVEGNWKLMGNTDEVRERRGDLGRGQHVSFKERHELLQRGLGAESQLPMQFGDFPDDLCYGCFPSTGLDLALNAIQNLLICSTVEMSRKIMLFVLYYDAVEKYIFATAYFGHFTHSVILNAQTKLHLP